VRTAYRYEDDIQRLQIWNNTIGKEVTRTFQAAESTADGLTVRNLLMLGSRPPEAEGSSNLVAADDWFVNAARHDYRLAAGAPAIDAGVTVSEVAVDRDGATRPAGRAYDVGAFEWSAPPLAPNGATDSETRLSPRTSARPRWTGLHPLVHSR
jgi:hypothetical protein